MQTIEIHTVIQSWYNAYSPSPSSATEYDDIAIFSTITEAEKYAKILQSEHQWVLDEIEKRNIDPDKYFSYNEYPKYRKYIVSSSEIRILDSINDIS